MSGRLRRRVGIALALAVVGLALARGFGGGEGSDFGSAARGPSVDPRAGRIPLEELDRPPARAGESEPPIPRVPALGPPEFSASELMGEIDLGLGDELIDPNAEPAPEPSEAVSPEVAAALRRLLAAPEGEALRAAEGAGAMAPDTPRYRADPALVGGALDVRRRAGGALLALAPEHVAATAVPSPTLYWWLAAPSGEPLELRFVEARSGEVLHVARLEPPHAAGFHAYADASLLLPEARDVVWSVSGGDREASAVLRFAPPRPTLLAQLAAAEPGREVHVLAESGYWIDAFALLAGRAATEPDAGASGARRDALLTQVGLPAR